MAEKLSFVVLIPSRLDSFLARETSRSRMFIKEQIEGGNVLVNAKPCFKASQKLKAEDLIEATLVETPRLELEPVEGRLMILFEDESLLAVNKPPGLVVHPAPGTVEPTLVHHLLHHLGESADLKSTSEVRPGIIHRLDRGTSGVILLAKNQLAQERLSAQFKARQVKKVYECLVWGHSYVEGRNDSKIGRDRVNRKRMSSRTDHGRESLTRWKQLTRFQHFTHLDVFPHTGRTHQIRVHLSEKGTPIVGDPLYGGGLSSRRQKDLAPPVLDFLRALNHTLLHARKLSFAHPLSGKLIELEAARPRVFDEALELLGVYERES